ncbi:MAG TPA: DNA mismatch repair protein MutS, partial [Aquirhabdus sp.]
AKLAGIPASVIKEARARLRALERQQAVHLGQNDLFDDIFDNQFNEEQSSKTHDENQLANAPENSALFDEIDGLNVDDLTPKQALDILYKLKELVSDSK